MCYYPYRWSIGFNALLLIATIFLSFGLAVAQDPVQDLGDEQGDPDVLYTEDDAGWVDMEYFLRHPAALNTVNETDLSRFPFLHPLQIVSFVRYREQMGPLLHVHELQAVLGWDLSTIRRILPYIRLDEPLGEKASREKWFRDGNHQVLLRYSQKFSDEESPPSPFKLFLRYQYAFQDRIRWAIVAEKDAGEPFFGPAQKGGFDFYGFHLSVRLTGKLRQIVLGDYSINMGQGLIHWQRMAFGKAADLSMIKRQAAVLQPYQSAGEFAFHRGLGMHWTFRRFNLYSFISRRALSATVERDDRGQPLFFSAFRNTGLHATESEQAGKNSVVQLSTGMVLRYQRRNLVVSGNFIYQQFSIPWQPQDRPYNRFAIRGRQWSNASVDYSYTWRNLHWFGEWAIDQRGALAQLSGLLASLGKGFDLALHRRDYAIRYKAVAAQSFGEGSTVGNERGWFMTVDWKPDTRWRVRAFSDFYFIPWISASRSSPARGGDRWAQLSFRASKSWEWTVRWRQGWSADAESRLSDLIKSEGWRFHVQIRMSGNIEVRHRAEIVRIRQPSGWSERGFSSYLELIWKWPAIGLEGSVRIQYFDTDGWSSRVYAYERDVLYFSTIPAFYGQGSRAYFLFRKNWGKRLRSWLKYGQTGRLNAGLSSGTNNDKGSMEVMELRAQLMYDF